MSVAAYFLAVLNFEAVVMEPSIYCAKLTETDRAVYFKKLRYSNIQVDPYALCKTQLSGDIEYHPPVTYLDICDYLISSPNPEYNFKSMKCHKSLKAHNFFTSGWVKEVMVSKVGLTPSTSASNKPATSHLHPVTVRGRLCI